MHWVQTILAASSLVVIAMPQIVSIELSSERSRATNSFNPPAAGRHASSRIMLKWYIWSAEPADSEQQSRRSMQQFLYQIPAGLSIWAVLHY